jgi:hypothetical protein
VWADSSRALSISWGTKGGAEGEGRVHKGWGQVQLECVALSLS